MKHFVIGTSGSGKTPFAKALAASTGLPYVSAGAWARERFPCPAGMEREQYIRYITDASTEALAKDPDLAYRSILTRIGPEGAVIDGVRNPRDFARLFDPRVGGDRTYRMTYGNNTLPVTRFEEGIEVIEAYAYWLIDAGIMEDAGRYRIYRYDRYWDRECGDRESSLERLIREAAR